MAASVWALRREVTGSVLEVRFALYTASLTTAMFTCVAEFAHATRPTLARALNLMPVTTRTIAMVSRAPAFTLAGAAIAISAVPVSIVVASSTGESGYAIVATIGALVSGALIVPPIVRSVQWVVVVSRRGALYAGALVCGLLAYAVAGGAWIVDQGVGAGAGWHWLLVWPVFVDLAIGPDAVSAAIACLLLAALGWASWKSIARLVTLDEVDASDVVRRPRTFRRMPMTTLSIVRGWRNRRSRSYLVAALAFTAGYFAVSHWSRASDVESAILVVALFCGGFGAVKRGLSRPVPVEVALLVEPRRYARSLLGAALAHATIIAAPSSVALGALAGRLDVALVTWCACGTASIVGTVVGVVLVPQEGDPVAELIAASTVLSVLVVAGNLADGLDDRRVGLAGWLLIAGAALAPAAPALEARRWCNRSEAAGGR